ncbi:MAG: ribbon-helix-helix domain-containing protein [Thermoproteota archaeon]
MGKKFKGNATTLNSKHLPPSSKKLKTSVTLDENLLSWIDEMISIKRFANRTHAIEYALQILKERSEKDEV